MAYIVFWTVVEKVKQKKNALFILPPISHDMYELKKRKAEAIRRCNGLLKTDAIAVGYAKVEQLIVQK